MLADVANVNSYEYVTTHEMAANDSGYVYFQLKDNSVLKSAAPQRFYPSGRRYIPAVGASLQVEVNNLNDARKIIRTATAPFTEDRSIWRLQILPTDNITAGTFSLFLTLNEGGIFTRGVVNMAMSIQADGCAC